MDAGGIATYSGWLEGGGAVFFSESARSCLYLCQGGRILVVASGINMNDKVLAAHQLRDNVLGHSRNTPLGSALRPLPLLSVL